MLFSAVVVNWNGKHYLDECLAALLAQSPPPLEVILVDNHSDDGSREHVAARFPQVRILDTGANLGPAAARNLGVGQARSARVLLVDNDVVVAPGCAGALLQCLDQDPGCALAQARSVCADDPETVHYDAADLHYLGMLVLHNWFVPRARAAAPAGPVGAAVALCILVDKAAFEAVGGFYPRLFILYEDNELAWKLRLSGRTLRLVPSALCRHKGGTAGLSVRGPHTPYPARRTFLHTRNRALVVRTCMHWRTLVMTWPARAVYGGVQFAFALARGHLGAWLQAQRELLLAWPEVFARRRTIQAMRRVPDRELLVALPLTLNPHIAARGVAAGLRHLLDLGFALWWRLTRRACG